MERNHIYSGHVLDVLRNMPDKSISCIVTSPPYWGLRDYQTEGITWDGDPECPHNFNPDGTYHDNMRFRPGKSTTVGNYLNPEIYTHFLHRGSTKSKVQNKSSITSGVSTSQFCSLCGSWFGSLGLEPTVEMYINHLIRIFDECKRILRDDGTCWVNIGDTYGGSGNGSWGAPIEQRGKHGSKHYGKQAKHLSDGEEYLAKPRKDRNTTPKCLCLIPERFAIAMTDSGWVLRNKIVWHKPNAMPASCKDRFTMDWEYVWFFSKKKTYYFEQQFEPIKMVSIKRNRRGVDKTNKYNQAQYQPLGGCIPTISKPREYKGYDGIEKEYRENQGRNKRCVWSISTKSFKNSHFATFCEDLIEPMILAGCPEFICSKCGKPRKQIFEYKREYETSIRDDSKENTFRNFDGKRWNTITTKVGYTDCGCGATFEPGIVADIFLGSGTTAVVAKRLGRDYVGIELNPDYVKMAEDRIANSDKVKVKVKKQRIEHKDQLIFWED